MPEAVFGEKHHRDGWCTIGEFYDEIAALINDEVLRDADFDHGKQTSQQYNPAPGTLYEVHSRADALKALEEIIDQGEGHSGKMYDKDHQLTHYWKFQIIADLMLNEIWDFHRDIYDMAASPDVALFSETATHLNTQFNNAWSELLDALHAAFRSPQPSLEVAIDLMLRLQQPAIALMQIPLMEKPGNAGPTFDYVRLRHSFKTEEPQIRQ